MARELATALDDARLASFRDAFHGEIVLRDDDEYDSARRVWNGMIDRRPALVVRCLTPEDVVQAIRLAERHRLVLAVRGGGHNIAGNAVCDGGLMIDLSQMTKLP